ncbi:conserved Plasmodium protein, unknown function, partial [Plasmodium malariae]
WTYKGGKNAASKRSKFLDVSEFSKMDVKTNVREEDENLFEPPLGEKEAYPSYMQPEEKNSSGWSEKWRSDENVKKENIKVKERGNEKEKRNTYHFFSSDNYAYNVPYNYKVVIPTKENTMKNDKGNIREEYSRDTNTQLNYTDYTGFRNPTLQTFENYKYWQDSGFKKFLTRIFPIKLPEHKTVDPLLREYIYFLHSFDPFRFSFKKLSERYFFSKSSIKAIYKEESVKRFLQDNELCNDKTKRISKKEAVTKIKELIYSKRIGYKDIGDHENVKNEEDQFQGYKNTFDQINRQVIQVESISSFPLPHRRDPVPKRVDVDMPVFNSANVKIMNWINPNDRVKSIVFLILLCCELAQREHFSELCVSIVLSFNIMYSVTHELILQNDFTNSFVIYAGDDKTVKRRKYDIKNNKLRGKNKPHILNNESEKNFLEVMSAHIYNPSISYREDIRTHVIIHFSSYHFAEFFDNNAMGTSTIYYSRLMWGALIFLIMFILVSCIGVYLYVNNLENSFPRKRHSPNPTNHYVINPVIPYS